ncbi:terpene cyclase/mutase family protein [Paenibacillus nasutitermitis]|uniref:Sporulenol synthase n=1 Tax=Paenibacillus nasutitermitis TaxID=1652958 RepID=A0A916YWH5_9BACL|nr:prenyltransferase/squalene oxidase repeat-containing protein [Paenibacillus nasutitermitis]GGD64591.1 sporulenol synthase [Paenibacillus nasutitermitis]
MLQNIQTEIRRLSGQMAGSQSADGSWRYGFIESGQTLDAASIVLMRIAAGKQAHDPVIQGLAERIVSEQGSDGAWRVYPDEPSASPSSTAENYVALLYAGFGEQLPLMIRARGAIREMGGLTGVDSLMTKFLLAVIGQYPWPRWFPVPLSIILLPSYSPIHFQQFSGYARVHIAPMLLLGHRKPDFGLSSIPKLAQPRMPGESGSLHALPEDNNLLWLRHFDIRKLSLLQDGLKILKNLPFSGGTGPFNAPGRAAALAEQFMLERIESDGLLYSYATSTFLMIYSLLAIGYKPADPVIANALKGIQSQIFQHNGHWMQQNTNSTVWDTALTSYALQEAGMPAEAMPIRKAGEYLLTRQHSKLGDWKLGVRHPLAGGWGFSDINTINPDMDDTTAALRAIAGLKKSSLIDDPYRYESASSRGLQWLLSMQNDDGGFAAFERNIDNPLLLWLPIEGGKDAVTDPSTADLTGRTLHYMGATLGLTTRHRILRRAADWLYDHQEQDGSWYGRWGVCYIYGTWAALTGLMAAGESAEHQAIRKAEGWLRSIQHPDGGFGESCQSNRLKRFSPLHTSVLSQTAWALDALIAISAEPDGSIQRAAAYLLEHTGSSGAAASYPTGAGLPGHFYNQYESYSRIWPLLAFSHYERKFGELPE